MAVKQTNQAFVLLGYTRSGFERERERERETALGYLLISKTWRGKLIGFKHKGGNVNYSKIMFSPYIF